jgi:hypothetical protein
MTTDRRRKTAVRDRQRAAGVPYSPARRQTRTLAEVLDEHPTLGSFGFGVFDAHSKTPAQREHELEQHHDDLRRAARDVDQVRGWLIDLAPIKTPTQSSHALKHVAERALGRYVSNGELIAAALLAGYPISRPDGGPNVHVAVSARDLPRIPADRR